MAMNCRCKIKKQSFAGFTLIEMAIVIMISGLLLAAGAPVYKTYKKKKNVFRGGKNPLSVVCHLSKGKYVIIKLSRVMIL